MSGAFGRSGPEAPDAAVASGGRRIRWSGPRAFLVECASLGEVVALHAQLAAEPLPGQVQALAAAETVALSFTHRGAAVAGAQVVRHGEVTAGGLREGRLVEIEVLYDGEDLQDVSTLTGLSPEGLVRWHTETDWVGAFGGFAPGFTYLTPADPGAAPLDIRRRASPRTSVPAGSVALAGSFSAVYPRVSPGGWQLIGRTGATLWDLDRDSPALVTPGDRVRYRAVRELVTVRTSGGPGPENPGTTPTGTTLPAQAAASVGPQATTDEPTTAVPAIPAVPKPALLVEHPGLQSLLQDLGRPGRGDLGVPVAGAADAASARQANRIVGNAPDAAVIETLLGGLVLRARGHHVLALAGAEGPARITAADDTAVADVNAVADDTAAAPLSAARPGASAERPAPARAPFALYDGELLTLGEPDAGLRTYVAVRGGLEAATVLGSRSTDTLSGLGPAPLSAGTEVPVRVGAGVGAVGTAVGSPEPPLRPMPRAGATTTLRVSPGPRDDWFGAAGLERLTGQDWEVGHQSNRIGVRLEVSNESAGAPLERIRDGELASEGAVAGALQVPPSGLPVLFLADHPVTGGYPVIGVVGPRDLTLAAQLPPGASVRFELTDLDAADNTDITDTIDAPDEHRTRGD
ncbi:carboxyltransferase domain-containing protein [Microbacterium sp. A93]|uniref:5-oxoprolinase subunit B/C family protein n=1 Tax=Microbacterium sp. A93 TaxID=3450716 RepID=UPI003F43C714